MPEVLSQANQIDLALEYLTADLDESHLETQKLRVCSKSSDRVTARRKPRSLGLAIFGKGRGESLRWLAGLQRA